MENPRMMIQGNPTTTDVQGPRKGQSRLGRRVETSDATFTGKRCTWGSTQSVYAQDVRRFVLRGRSGDE